MTSQMFFICSERRQDFRLFCIRSECRQDFRVAGPKLLTSFATDEFRYGRVLLRGGLLAGFGKHATYAVDQIPLQYHQDDRRGEVKKLFYPGHHFLGGIVGNC